MTTHPVAAQIEAINEFAVALDRRLHQGWENRVHSPRGLRIVLAMALVGARAETASEMARALRWNEAEPGRIAPGPGLTIANSIWVQRGVPLRPEYLEVLANQFEGHLEPTDFTVAETARSRINRWIDENTLGRIRDLIPPGAIDAMTRVVLANAIHFQARWRKPFDQELTQAAQFHLEDGSQARARMMRLSGGFLYAEDAEAQVLRIPYELDDVSMVVVLPRRPDGLRTLSPDIVTRALRDRDPWLQHRFVSLHLPRFAFTWGTYQLSGVLSQMGMPRAFDPSRADFSGMNGCRPPDPASLSLDAVFHQARIEVTEWGTEAAAASATAFALLSAPSPRPKPIEFRADRPFWFAIVRRGAVVFMGRLVDPTPTTA